MSNSVLCILIKTQVKSREEVLLVKYWWCDYVW